MEKQKQTALPKETPEQRPALFVAVVTNHWGEKALTDGIWLAKGDGKIQVKIISAEPFPGAPASPNYVGAFIPCAPLGPKYTGPIDDEMMANILIYG